jgi:hypothetical protein
MFGRKAIQGEVCTACDRRLVAGEKVCVCGTATRFMTFEERAAHEVELWRRSRAANA